MAGECCNWSMMKNWCPCMGCTALMEAEFEVQHTIKRAELTAFLCFLTKVIRSIKAHVESKGVIDGLWRGERKCIDPKVGDADLWKKSGKHCTCQSRQKIQWKSEHVKAHRTKKYKKYMSHFEIFLLMAMGKWMSWQRQERCWTKASWRKREQRQCSSSEKRFLQPCSMQPVFAVWWKHGRTVKSSSRSQNKSGFSWTRKRGDETSNGVVC